MSGSVRQRMCPHRRVYAPSPRMFCDAGHPDAHDLDNGLIRGMTHPIGRITSLPNTCARWPPTPPPEGEGRRIARDMYSANMVSTLVRGHPCPQSPCVSHRVPSFGTNGVALAAAYLEGQAGKQSGPGGASQSASRPSPPHPDQFTGGRPQPLPQREGRRTARDMYSANMDSTLVRGHPCPHSPYVPHRVPSI